MTNIKENSIEDDLKNIESGGWDAFYDEQYDDPGKAARVHNAAENYGMSDLDYVNKMDILDQLYDEDDWIYDIETENDDFDNLSDKYSAAETYANYEKDWENGETSLFGPWGPTNIKDEKELLENVIEVFWENGISEELPYGGPHSLQSALDKLSKYANDERTPASQSLYIELTKMANEFNSVAEKLGIEKPLNIPSTLKESKDYKFKAKVGDFWLQKDGKGWRLCDDKSEADEFESETEPKQIIKQKKKDGEVKETAKVEITKVFESVLNEEINRTSYPTKTSFNNGKVKKVPLVMKYIYENPGCTKEDIISFTNAMGFTGYNCELLVDIVDDGMVTTSKKGRKLAFYPTELLTGYLHTLGFIDDDSGDEIYNQFTTNKDGYVQAQKHKQCIARTRSYFVDRLSQVIHDIKKPSYRFPDISKDWAKLNDDEKREILVAVASKIILK